MSTFDLSIRISGDAGQGLESGGAGFALAAARSGHHVFATPDYRSRVRGGNNFFQLRLADRPVYGHSEKVHILVALTADSIALHGNSVAAAGVVIAPEEITIEEQQLSAQGVTVVRLPLVRIAKAHGDKLMANTAALAALASMVEFPLSGIEDVIRANFAKKGPAVLEGNLAVAAAAYEAATGERSRVPYRIPAAVDATPRLLMNGNQAFALGALAGGCRFMAAYPMTPATTIVEWLSALPVEYGMVTKHTEDEISAVCMAIGASFAGARAMTATSGGGFCLMTEALGLAGMTEVPLVVVDAQRGGPSTGLPTRTEQSDLLFVIHAGHGEFPRIVLAPRTVSECFETGGRAFNLADRYQCPVIVLTDTLLASSVSTVDPEAIDFRAVEIDRGATLDSEDLKPSHNGYHRYEFSGSGISPRALPGTKEAVYAIASDEHDESGHITEDAENRVAMMQKRMRKLDTAAAEMRPPRLEGEPAAETTLVAWGSTYGACLEAVRLLNESGVSANLVSFADLWPLPVDAVGEALAGRYLVAVEQNYTSELALLLRMTTGIAVDMTITRYDGRPLTADEIAAKVKEARVVRV